MAQIIQWSFRVVSQKERSEQTCFGPAEIAPNGIELFVRLCYRQTHRNKSAATLFLSAATAALILLYFFEFPFCFKWLFVCLFLWGECFTIFSWTHCSMTPWWSLQACLSLYIFFLKALINRKAAFAVEEWGLSIACEGGSKEFAIVQRNRRPGCSRGSRPPLTNQINQSINYFAAKTRLI